MTSVALVAAEMKEEGHDAQTISSQFLNGAAVLLSRRCDEEAFVALARRMWRATVSQLELAELVDRAMGQAVPKCPQQRTLHCGNGGRKGKKS